ncbi:MAG TPA: hypothetical protein DEP84_05995, partial [Chloroflexi bacterium]|nr:hypothetical protein [Chloroflexota bacterium]
LAIRLEQSSSHCSAWIVRFRPAMPGSGGSGYGRRLRRSGWNGWGEALGGDRAVLAVVAGSGDPA